MNTFRILAQFLKTSEEVEGRELPEPTEETKLNLQRLALGQLPESERPAVFAELNTHPEWVGWLAGEIKKRRVVEC